MLSRLANIFRVPDLRNKVLFTLAVIALYQIGANIPVPGVNWSRLQSPRELRPRRSGVLGFLNLFSGGALVRLAVFGLGVMPYITSSIIIQLLSTVIPKLEEWRDQGAVGQKKITQTTRYLTVALAVMQSAGLVYAFHGHDAALLGTSVDLIPNFSWPLALFMVLILTAGHGLRHVAGRADHPARHRPGHVDPDLRQRRGRHPDRVQGHLRGGGNGEIHGDTPRLTDPPGRHRLHGPGAATDPGHLRPPGGGPAHVRRELDLHTRSR